MNTRTVRRCARLPEAMLVDAASAVLAADGYEEPKPDRGLFAPRPRGILADALADPCGLCRVAPESPRPVEMLESVMVAGGMALTAQDLALHELLVATAYEAGLAAAVNGYPFDVVGRELTIPMRAITRFLGPSVRRPHVLKSLANLRAATVSYGVPGKRRYTDVPMLVVWGETGVNADAVRFVLPSPVWRLLASQPRYAYLELAALAQMGTRYGVHLYKRLALRLSLERWSDDRTPFRIELTPEEAAGWIGYDARPIIGSRLTTTLKRAVRDLESVRGFSVEWLDPVLERSRGAPVARYVLGITLRPPRVPDRARHTGIAASLPQPSMNKERRTGPVRGITGGITA